MSEARKNWAKKALKSGEHYAGIILGQNGESDYHLIVMAGEAKNLTFKQAIDWAKKQGGELPNRREQRVLYANAKEAFQPEWYWSGEQHAANSDSAWGQDFTTGNQDFSYTYNQLRARAVRRVPIE